MTRFILNDQDIDTDLASGTTVLDFVRYHKNLKGTKIGCREGDCGACTVMVGELVGDKVKYRTMTSCLMPLANAAGQHIVTIEGINTADGSLTPVQQAMVDESGTQCGFCTVGFVMSLTAFCVERVGSPHVSKGSAATVEAAISSIDGNICRCTGYKSIERAAARISCQLPATGRQEQAGNLPAYFAEIPMRLAALHPTVNRQPAAGNRQMVAGGTDLYVQCPDEMAEADSTPLFYDEKLRGIRDAGEFIEIGPSATVTDLLESPVMQTIFPDLYKHLKLVSSTPIRNMATLAGNFVNASPIGDMTVWFLALDAKIILSSPPYEGGVATAAADGVVFRELPLRNLYLGYKKLAKQSDEIITSIRFKKPTGDFRFNFEKVCKRTYLDIATVNTAISLRVSSPSVSSPHVSKGSSVVKQALTNVRATDTILEAHIAAGGVAPIPLYLKETSAFLRGKEINEATVYEANKLMQFEIAPISDVRGTEEYKRLLLKQLFRAHFVELFDL